MELRCFAANAGTMACNSRLRIMSSPFTSTPVCNTQFENWCASSCRYDANGDGKIDSSELRSLCSDAGKNLTEEETKAALNAIDENENGVIEFNEFVGFWVNPSKYVAELKSISEADKKESSTDGTTEAVEKDKVSSVTSS